MLYYKLKAQNAEAKLDCTSFTNGSESRRFMLDVLSLPYEAASESEVRRLAGNKGFWGNVRRRLLGQKKTIYAEKGNSVYDDGVYGLDGRYFVGYWQTERYFFDVREEILGLVHFPEITDEVNHGFLSSIRECNSVAVHIRRGDYLEAAYRDRFFGICDDEYYENAMEYVRDRVDNPRFFVFSNDVRWCEEHYGGCEDVVIVKGNDEDACYNDLNLMRYCRHDIIANSSFSWWGAWLNENAEKIVIAPKVWLNGEKTPDIWCDGWIRM
jgi:hypothetical protein